MRENSLCLPAQTQKILIILREQIVYCRDDGNLSMQAEKEELFRSESKKKTIFSNFNFNMVNIGFMAGLQ